MHKTYKKSLVLNKRIIQLTVLITLAITGCAKINHVSTNLDRDNFKVKMVEKEQDLAGKYKFLGLVEGESCQEKAYHAAPNEIDARTEARRKAYQLGANAIIFSQCVMITDDKAAKYCLASTLCYGRAFKVEQENK